MRIQIKTAVEMFGLGRDVIARAKKEILTKLALNARKQIRSRSAQNHIADLRAEPNVVTIGEPFSRKDPTGSKALDVERRTKAYKLTKQSLSDKKTVVDLINRGR
jgi:UDP-N-acetylmuramyl pentapeptide synthase